MIVKLQCQRESACRNHPRTQTYFSSGSRGAAFTPALSGSLRFLCIFGCGE
jgi:hypothetical protein